MSTPLIASTGRHDWRIEEFSPLRKPKGHTGGDIGLPRRTIQVPQYNTVATIIGNRLFKMAFREKRWGLNVVTTAYFSVRVFNVVKGEWVYWAYDGGTSIPPNAELVPPCTFH